MNKKGKLLLKNVGILTVSNFASKILVFFLVPLYTSILSTSEYGIYDLVVTTISLIFPIVTLNIVDAVMRYLLDGSYDKKQVTSIGMGFCIVGICLGGLFLAILSRMNLCKSIKGLEVYIFLYFLSYIINQYMIQFAKGLDAVKEMGIAGVMGTLMMIVANLLFLLMFNCGLKGFFTANILCQAMPAIFLIIRLGLWDYISFKKLDKRLIAEMLLYCIPLIASAVGWWVNSSSDRYVVIWFCGIAANGVLSVAYKIPSMLNTFQYIFIQAWQISAVKEYGRQDTSVFYGKIFVIINFLMSVVCSLLIILTKPLAHILYAKDFFQAWEYVPFLLVSCVINSASGILGPILSAKRDSKSMMWSAIIGAGTNVIMNIILVKAIGIQGAVIATLISSLIIFKIRKKAVGKDITINSYFLVLMTWGVLVLQSCAEIYMENYLIEILFIIMLLGFNLKYVKEILLINKRMLIDIINKGE